MISKLRSGGWLGWLALIMVLVSIYLVFMFAPTEKEMGHLQRAFYWHVPANITGFGAFFVACIGSIGYLLTKQRRWDILALSAVEVGVLLASIGIVTGSIWARPTWGTWWTWDPRLTTSLILWLIYVGYLMLRTAVEDPERRARFAAVLGIIGFVDVPIVYMSARWWRTIHPVLFEAQEFRLTPPMLFTFLFSMATLFVLFTFILVQRIRLEQSRDELERLKHQLLLE